MKLRANRWVALIFAIGLVSCQGSQIPDPDLPSSGAASLPAASSGYLYVAVQGANEVLAYSAPYTGKPFEIKGLDHPQGLAYAHDGEIFVANEGSASVDGFATPNYQGKKNGTLLTRISSSQGLQAPQLVALDSHDDLFVMDQSAGLLEFKPPYKNKGIQLDQNTDDVDLLVGDDDSVFLALSQFEDNGPVERFLPPSYHSHQTINKDCEQASSMWLTPAGALWVYCQATYNVNEYVKSDYTGNPKVTIGGGSKNYCCAVAVNYLGDVFIHDDVNAYLYEYKKPLFDYPYSLTNGAQVFPYSMTFDSAHNFFAYGASGSEGAIEEYAPPYYTKNGGNLVQTLTVPGGYTQGPGCLQFVP